MTGTQAIVFDMDGVLIDSEELHAHAKRIAFAHAGIALSDADLLSPIRRPKSSGNLNESPNYFRR